MDTSYCFLEHITEHATGEHGLIGNHNDETQWLFWKTRGIEKLIGTYHPILEDGHGPLFYIKKRQGVKTPRFVKKLVELQREIHSGYYTNNLLELRMWAMHEGIPERTVLMRIP